MVQPGFAVVDGGLCKEDEVRTLSVTAADAIYDRIDTVVLRWNENVDVRTADLYVLAGTPAETPVRPALQRNDSIYEIGLADVFITHGIATITGDKITDTRYESERCGIVSSVSEWDTTTIYQQVQTDLAGFKATEQAEFMAWFETIRDILDESTAGHLQNEIDKNAKDISDANGRLTQTEAKVNNIDERLTAENNMPFRFAFDTNSGKYGYITESGGADTFNPFRGGSAGEYATLVQEVKCDYPANRGTLNKTLDENGLYCIVTNSGNLDTYGVSRGTPKLNNVPLTAMADMSFHANGASVYFFHADAGDVVYNYMSMSNPNSGYARTWLFKID